MEIYGAKLPPDERVRLALDALALTGRQGEWRQLIAALLEANTRPQIYEVIGTHLVRQPEQALLREVAAAWSRNPAVETEAGLAANTTLLCAAVTNGDEVLYDRMRSRVQEASGARSLMLERLGEHLKERLSRRRGRPLAPQSYLPALPQLPQDTAYALFERAAADLCENLRQP